jgi:phosphoglucomutase
MRINTKDHSVLKERYQKIFTREWEERKNELKEKYGFHGWEAIAYNGMEEKRGIKCFKENGNGGLKICFLNGKGKETAYIWMRGSATEPVFRVMADAQIAEEQPAHVPAGHIEGMNNQLERDLLNWQKRMIMEADVQSSAGGAV